MKLSLGTAQFGLKYGVSNTSGQVDRNEVSKILNLAQNHGIDTLDTAINYGDSEQRLGEVGLKKWQIVTKLPKFPDKCIDVVSWVKEQVRASLTRLGVEQLRGILLHYPYQLHEAKGKDLWSALQIIKGDGLVRKIGFSVYDPSELDNLWPNFQPDLVQCPYNILDRRLLSSGWLDRMSDSGVEIHVRSVFLQGLLLISEKDRPRKFNRWSKIWELWHTWLHDNNITSLEGSLIFVNSNPRINRIIVGIETLSQLKEILSVKSVRVISFPEELSILDRELINPSRWDLI